MINYVEGKIIQKTTTSVSLLTKMGIAFELFVSMSSLKELKEIGEEDFLYCYLKLSENDATLIGFKTTEEKALFLNLIENVSGVGAKSALLLLSGDETYSIVSAIVTGNVNKLSSIKGVGRKTAERICFELREKLIKQGAQATKSEVNNVKLNEVQQDAMLAVVSLGVKEVQAIKYIEEVSDENDTVESLIKKVLGRIRR